MSAINEVAALAHKKNRRDLTLLCLDGNCLYQAQSIEAFNSGCLLNFCNRVIVTKAVDTVELTGLKEFYGGTPYTLWVDANGPEVKNDLISGGFALLENIPVMVIDLDLLKPAPRRDACISVRNISEKNDILSTWIPIVIKAYSPQLSAKMFQGCVQEWQKFFRYLQDSQSYNCMQFFLGYWNDIPAATGLFIFNDDSVYIHWIGTLPEFRRKGLGFEITQLPLHELKRKGAKKAFLFASPMGRPLYEKIGFQVIGSYDIYNKVSSNNLGN